MGERFRLLSIDGGGIRGLIPAMVLAHLEKKTGRATHELFDAVSGTSTGAIVALGLVRPMAKRGDAARLVELYLREAPKIFREDWRDRLGVIPRLLARWLGTPSGFDTNDLWKPRYTADARRHILGGYFESTQLVEAILPAMVPAYCTERRCPIFFTTRPEHASTAHTYYESTCSVSMLDAVMASTAAPTYFPPEVQPRPGDGRYSLIDGSVYAANPTAIARAFLRDQTRNPDGDIILSLGTGAMQRPYGYDAVRGWGLGSWAGPLLDILIDGQAETTGTAVQLDHAGAYLRMQGMLGDLGASDALDNCSSTNLDAIGYVATAMIGRYEAELDALAKLLVAEV